MGVLRVNEAGVWKDVYPPTTNPNPGNVFANAAARDAGLPNATEGMTCYLLDLHQQQVFANTGRWDPCGGQVPYCDVADPASQSITANAWNKFTLNDTTPVNQGGASFDPATDGINVVPGMYMVNVRVSLAATAGESFFSLGSGNPTAYTSAYNGASINANISMTYGATWYTSLDGSYPLCIWINCSVARAITNRIFRMHYIGPRYA